MLNNTDQENIMKACKTVELLMADITDIIGTQNPLLADFALEIQLPLVQVKQRLDRICSMACRVEESS